MRLGSQPQSSVSFLKISKDGKYINKFIATKSTAVQEPESTENLALEEKYLRKVSLQKEKKNNDLRMSRNRNVRDNQVNIEAGPPMSESLLRNVLQGLVDLLKPTEVVKFVTPLRASAINDELIEPRDIVPAQVTDEGEILRDAISDLYVAIIANSESTIEEYAVFILKQSIHEATGKITRKISNKKVTEGERESVLDLHPDNPQEIQKIATKLLRKHKKSHNKNKKISKLEVICLLEIVRDTTIDLKGGGKILLTSKKNLVSLNTSSVRSMWGFFMALQKAKQSTQTSTFDIGSFAERLSGNNSHSWVAQYFDESTTIPEASIRMENVNDNDYQEDTMPLSSRPRKRSLMASLTKILQGFDIEDITMKDVYDGLQDIYGEGIVGPEGYTKSEIDTFTMRAVGQLEPPSKIVENLYLGSEYNACNRSEIEELGIDLIVNVTEEVENFFEDKFRYVTISLRDVPSSELKPYFKETIQKMKETIDSGKPVLVHCQRGVSRSATIVISYLMVTRNMTAAEAIAFAKSKRNIVKPNKGFKQQLKEFEEELESS